MSTAPEASQPRDYSSEHGGWPVSLFEDRQGNCRSCEQPIYWVEIRTKTGAVKAHPMSEATGKQVPDLPDGWVIMSSHFADCPNAQGHRPS